MKSGWKKYLLYSILIIVGGSLLFGLIRLGYLAEWTGFGEYTSTSPNAERGKTLWDWMELLIIPLFLAGGVFYLNWSERKTEREIAKDRQQEAALQVYIDRMSELLLKGELQSDKNKEARNVARIRSLSVLRGLDERRKGFVLRFLKEADLINRENTLVDLSGADLALAELRGANLVNSNLQGVNLQNADLYGAGLHNADLQFANLQKTNFNRANLLDANLSEANLFKANLTYAVLAQAVLEQSYLRGVDLSDAELFGARFYYADLSGANLSRASLIDAILESADLTKANLRGAKVTDVQLATTHSLRGAIMPDGTKHE